MIDPHSLRALGLLFYENMAEELGFRVRSRDPIIPVPFNLFSSRVELGIQALPPSSTRYSEVSLRSANIIEYSFSPTTVVCCGGGVDSFIATVYAILTGHKNIVMFNMNYGAEYGRAESEAVDRQYDVLEPIAKSKGAVITLHKSALVSDENTYDIPSSMLPKGYIFPHRNAMLVSFATSIMNHHGGQIWVAANYRQQDGDGVTDKSPQFFSHMGQLLSQIGGIPLTVTSPFLHMSKRDTIEWYNNSGSGVRKSLNELTFSCYEPRKYDMGWERCGNCYACYKTRKVGRQLNIHFDFAHLEDEERVAEYKTREKSKGRNE